MSFVFHITVATADMQHPPPHCIHIHFLVSINVHQVSVNVSGCSFFPNEGIKCFHVRLPHCCHVAQQQNLEEYCLEGSTSTAIQLTSAFDVMSQHNEIGEIIFGADLVGVGDKTEIIHQYLVNNYAV